jgi:hypothetical protein
MIDTKEKEYEYENKISQNTSEPTEDMESNWEEVIESFDELGLKKDLLRGKLINPYI